jgi:LCP family protein required for cell wall assembly
MLLAFATRRALDHRPFDTAPPLPPASRIGVKRKAVLPPNGICGSGNCATPRLLERVERVSTPPLTKTDNILLVGLDSRRGLSGAISRTDALLVLVIDRRSNHVGIISVPRDLLVSIPGYDEIRINTVYRRIARDRGSEAGARALRRSVSGVLGLPISRAVFVDHGGFEKLIDTLGGITVRVRCPIRDRFIDKRVASGRRELLVQAGMQHMDGKTALMFSRSRHGRGVADRARRQQAVVFALWQRLVQMGVQRARELWPLLSQTIYTDLTVGEMLGLGRRVARVPRQNVHGLVLRWRHVLPMVTADGRWVMIAKPRAIAASLRQLFKHKTPGFKRAKTCKPLDAALQSKAK